MKDKLIFRPFNSVFFGSILIYSSILAMILHILDGKSSSRQRMFVCAFYILSLFVFLLYKYAISKDRFYYDLLGFDKFNWLNELPLNVCNFVLLLMPIGILTGSRTIFSICFFSSLILSPMALIMPRNGFSGYSALTPRVFGYLLTHFMAISAGVMLLRFKIYSPVMSDLPRFFVVSMILNFLIYLLNKWFRKTGLNPKSNYFFNADTEGIPAFELCYKLIPYEFLYSLPVFAAFSLAAMRVTALINL